MKLLTAVNLILPKLGEHTVTSVESRHPTLGIILPQLDLKLGTVQGRGWWFNTQAELTLYPDNLGKIAVPENLLSFEAFDEYPAMHSEEFWNSKTGLYKFDGPISGKAIYRFGFEDLPESAARLVLYEACVEAYLTDIGREPIVAEWKELARRALADVELEHLRMCRYSTRKSPRWARRLAAMRA